MTRKQAVEALRRLVARYGTRWRADVPASARALGKFQIPAGWEIETSTGTKHAIIGATSPRSSSPRA
jgi:hypothetical protein